MGEPLSIKQVPIDQIVIEGRFRKDLGDLSDLVESITTIGLLFPVALTTDRRLIDGQRRIEACCRLGWTEIDAVMVTHLQPSAGHAGPAAARMPPVEERKQARSRFRC